MTVDRKAAAAARSFLPHKAEWSPNQVRRFWDYYSTNPSLEHSYFARIAGNSLLTFVRRKIRINTAADIGCGRGDLIEILLHKGYDTFGFDQSPESIRYVKKRFINNPRFKGAVLLNKARLPTNLVDTAFLLEVVEHLPDDALVDVIRAAHQVIRPGGYLVVTTPNNEDLHKNEVMCPECGNKFHRVQHVRSWSATSLSVVLTQLGFEPIHACETVLGPYAGLLGVAYRIAYRLVRKGKPNLVIISRRP